MERIQSINPDRIQWCCDDRDITTEELAANLKIAHTSVKNLMIGEEGVTFNQLRKIADYFNRGVLFFLEPEPANDKRVHTSQFRTIANQKPELDAKIKAVIERVERHRDVYLSLREDLSDADERPFSPPKLMAKNSKEAAAIARDWLGLSENKNTFDDYRQAVEARGILVFRSNGYNGPWQISKDNPICGFSLYDPACPVIVVKKQQFKSRQVFTLMHELGHVLLHRSSFIDEEEDLYSYQGKEREANAFAGQLIVPDRFLKHINDDDRPDEVDQYDNWLSLFRRQWGCSSEVILRRLLDGGRLNSKQYKAYRLWRSELVIPEKEGGTRQYRYLEPGHMFGEPFVRTVLDALSAKHISLAKASTYLDNLKIKDVHQLEGAYANL
jgi:Zn-dependent peptidase ImmA (M78 family)/plasmid maintenance system antidote protein VapI